jgi:hypothetical protein
MSSRPVLTRYTAVADFRSFYWLKAELVTFCREHHLPTTGAKQELAQRIAQYLSGEALSAAPLEERSARACEKPKIFTRATVITPGWRCSQELRAFFEQEIGPRFHFDAAMRDLIYQGSGKTLHEIIEAWMTVHNQPARQKEIAPQFEYNRHIQDYFQTHPGASLQDAIEAWKVKKRLPRRDRC